MGMILGAALAGGAAGAEKSVEDSMAQMRQEGLIRLREQYENTRQQTQIEAGKAQQERGFGEEEKMHGIEHAEAVTAAEATRKYESGAQAISEAGKNKREQEHSAAMVAVGAGHDTARLGAAANKPQPKEWTPNVHTYPAMVPDPSDPSGKRLMPGQKSTTTLTHRSGLQLVQLDDGRYVQFKGDIANIPKPNSIGRAPAEKEQLLIQNPTKWPDFLAKYNYLSREWMQSQTYHDQDVARGGPGLQGPVSTQPPRNAQSGPTFIDRYNAEHGMPPPGGALSQARAANGAGTGGVGRPSTDEVESNDNIEDARLVTEEAEANGQEASQDTDPAREPGQ